MDNIQTASVTISESDALIPTSSFSSGSYSISSASSSSMYTIDNSWELVTTDTLSKKMNEVKELRQHLKDLEYSLESLEQNVDFLCEENNKNKEEIECLMGNAMDFSNKIIDIHSKCGNIDRRLEVLERDMKEVQGNVLGRYYELLQRIRKLEDKEAQNGK